MDIYVIDIETTGLDGWQNDHVVEISIMKANLTKQKIEQVYHNLIHYDTTKWDEKTKNAWIFEKDIIKLDEIQNAPAIFAKLRYFYEDLPDLHIIAAGSLLEFLLAEHTFSGDKIVEEETTINEVNFLNRSAYWLEGTWQNPELVIGGPFRNITFVDEQSQFIFMIDYYVQAINRRKKLFLDQMEIMAKTFKTKTEIEAEKDEK